MLIRVSPDDCSEEWDVSDFNDAGDALELETADGDDEAADDADERGGQIEGVRVVLDAGVEVHAEDAAAASREGDAQGQDFHVKVHLDDVVSCFVLNRSDNLMTLKAALGENGFQGIEFLSNITLTILVKNVM